MMLNEATLPPLQSLLDGPSTVFWVAVMAWTVVIRPPTIPNRSLITLARGARQLVVQLALETMLSSGLYSFSLTPTTNIGASLLGAEMTTFLAPPFK
uniref:Uncharacterized protein n=1 Tax=Medicago truncatula TaxID=3880 RepID=I3SR02_MEDTR|nr:unknown [Medicago truncatula]